ncbi:hypothetical protein AVEN_104773-1 [Araneus ventricosus]|uniref:EGF-like domain-containing protein n=1 Tax=Araneus ventricosus TaxID=182803 RepID=A0A4Y2KG21_ARAVE|nr:hypothetical protein AVEN_104773-1 [Araneus ventricosus]
MRCVRKEIILLLFINAFHEHCITALETQNISETDRLLSLKEYESSACDCGPDTNCTWSRGRRDRKNCFCKPGYAQRNSKCVDCDCGPDSNCTFSGPFQQKKCICQPGYRDVHGKCVVNSENNSCRFNPYFTIDCEMISLNPFLLTANDQQWLSFHCSEMIA